MQLESRTLKGLTLKLSLQEREHRLFLQYQISFSPHLILQLGGRRLLLGDVHKFAVVGHPEQTSLFLTKLPPKSHPVLPYTAWLQRGQPKVEGEQGQNLHISSLADLR